MTPITLSAAVDLKLHQPYWRVADVEHLLALNPQLLLRQALLQVSERRAGEYARALQKRRGEIVIGLYDEQGRFLLHTKSFYYPGVYRLLTGGIHVQETVLAALQREALEETGQILTEYHPLAVLFYTFQFGVAEIPFISYLFSSRVRHFEPKPLDQEENISGFSWVDRQGLQKATDFLLRLPPAWQDWGQVRALPHLLLLDF
jgi:8-oxo-dGTP pyrophosphatase MutT (NUDIX family)